MASRTFSRRAIGDLDALNTCPNRIETLNRERTITLRQHFRQHRFYSAAMAFGGEIPKNSLLFFFPGGRGTFPGTGLPDESGEHGILLSV